MRRVLVVLVTVILAVQVVRNAAVIGLAETTPATAAKLWSGHPSTELALAMTDIAAAARSGHAAPPSSFAAMADAAGKAPLAPEPFLVRGVQAQLAGDEALAQRAFEAAQWRDPRSLPAAYFLADRYFRAGNLAGGLREVAALARLSPNGAITVSPYLASYAAKPSSWPALRALFRANPDLEQPTLSVLSSNLATVPAVLALADVQSKNGDAQWLPTLLNTLIAAGQYDQARVVWARASGVQLSRGDLLHDASFSDKRSSAPFNWTLESSAVGIAERQRGGRLHVVFYDQQDGFLATQLLLLQPGAYRLSMKLGGNASRAGALNWSIWCDKAAEPLASVTLSAAAAHGWQFDVPAGCAAQWLRLSGSSSDMPQPSDVTISALKLVRVTPGA